MFSIIPNTSFLDVMFQMLAFHRDPRVKLGKETVIQADRQADLRQLCQRYHKIFGSDRTIKQ